MTPSLAPSVRKAGGKPNDVFVPLRTRNPLNNRSHWRVVSRVSKTARSTTVIFCRGKLTTTRPAVILLTRHSPGEMDDDNVAAALKPVRDGVADVFGCDDSRKSGLTFKYAQAKSKEHGVRVQVLEGGGE